MPETRKYLGGNLLPVLVIISAVAFLMGRYLLFGVPHEFITGEYKATFEGDYDFTIELVESVRQWGSLPLWSDTYSGPIAVFASNFHVFEQALLYPLTGDLAVSIKILQALQFLIAGLGMYLLSNYLFKDRMSAAFSSVLYMFTPFYIGHLLSYLHYTGVYLLAPLVYFLMLKTMDERSYYYALLLCPVIAYSLLSHPQNVFIGGIFYALFYVLAAFYKSYQSLTDGELKVFVKKLIPITALIVIVTFALSAFIVLPTLADNYPYLRTSWVKGAGALVKVDHGHIGSHSQSILASITLQHWPWFQTPLKGSQYPAWPYMAVYLMPFALAAASVAIRFDWITFVFFVMTAASVQIALGIKGEPDLFTLASKYVPFFGMSRTPYAYINSAILVFCLFSSVTFLWLRERLTGLMAFDGQRRVNTGWLLFALLAIPYLFAARYYGNDYNWSFISAKQPDYLASVWGWMDENNRDRGRVIETCGIPTAMILGQRMLPNQVDLLERYHKKEYLGDYLALLGLKYVITPTMHSQRDRTFDVKGYMVPSVFDRRESMEEYYSALTTEYYHIYERLRADPGFKLYTAGTKDVGIFENTKAFPDYRVYQATPLMVLGGTEAYDLLSLGAFKGAHRIAPVFIAQKENLKRLADIRGVSGRLILHNTDSEDLRMLFDMEKAVSFRPEPKKGDWSLSIHSFGIQQPFPQQDHSIGNSLFGEFSFSDFPITAAGAGASVMNTFEVPEKGVYRVRLRSYAGPDKASLTASLDGKDIGRINQGAYPGYRWITLYEGGLKGGAHSLELTLDEDKPVYFDRVVVEKGPFAGNNAGFEDFKDKGVTYIVNHRRFSVKSDRVSTVMETGAGRFAPSVRLARSDENAKAKTVSLVIDGKTVGVVPAGRLENRIKEFTFPDVELRPGPHKIEIAGLKDGIFFDLISLSSKGPDEMKAGSVLYERTGPSSYKVRADRAGFIVFNETNYPGWRIRYKEKEDSPLITNMFMNGFILPEGGEFEIYYSNAMQRLGIAISSLALLAISLVVIIRPLTRRKANVRRRQG